MGPTLSSAPFSGSVSSPAFSLHLPASNSSSGLHPSMTLALGASNFLKALSKYLFALMAIREFTGQSQGSNPPSHPLVFS